MPGQRNPRGRHQNESCVAPSDHGMSLPNLIEIVPPGPLGAVSITVPGSKSITNRALILAALAQLRARPAADEYLFVPHATPD